MEEFSFLMPLLLAIGGLLVGALLKSLLRHSRVPYTVALFAVGLLVGLADRNGLFHAIPRHPRLEIAEHILPPEAAGNGIHRPQQHGHMRIMSAGMHPAVSGRKFLP